DEIIVEGWIAPDEAGSGEGDPDGSNPGEDGGTAGGAAGWREYRFEGKRGDGERISPLIAPYHLRLDWRIRLAALADYRRACFARSWAPTPAPVGPRNSSASASSPTATPPAPSAGPPRPPGRAVRGGCGRTRAFWSGRPTCRSTDRHAGLLDLAFLTPGPKVNV